MTGHSLAGFSKDHTDTVVCAGEMPMVQSKSFLENQTGQHS